MRNGEGLKAKGLVPAVAWIDESRLGVGARIYEDSILQPYYKSVLTVLTINEPLGTVDNYDQDSLLDELDPNEFTINRRRWR